MKNTLQKGKFRILIYRGKEGYVGICYETGFVDVGENFQEVQQHINNGIVALLKTIKSGKITEQAINQHPQLKYRLAFYVLPAVSNIFHSLDVSFFTKPIFPNCLANA